MNKPKKCIRWVTVEWCEAAETWMVDIRIETAPPGKEYVYFGFGHQELKELHHKIGQALRAGRKRNGGQRVPRKQ